MRSETKTWRWRQAHVHLFLFVVSTLVMCEPGESSREFTLSENRGDSLGGEEVTVTGSGFSADMRVVFGDIDAQAVELVSDTELKVITPQHPPGEVDVSLVDAVGNKWVCDEPFIFENILQITSVDPSSGSVTGTTRVTIVGSGFTEQTAVLFGKQSAEEIEFINDRMVTAITPPGEEGSVDVEISVPGRPLFTLENGFAYVAATPGSNALPRVVSAAALDNTSVTVVFSEAMDDEALAPGNYAVSTTTEEETSTRLLVSAATFVEEEDGEEDRSRVLLETGSQSGVSYTVHVSNVRDLDDNIFGPPEMSVGGAIIDPAVAIFTGIPPSGEPVDSDEDGLVDSAEQLGWNVNVLQTDGTTVTFTVTSDPFNADTDDDGIIDFDEKFFGLNPRSADTDADNLTDFQELNEIYANPAEQDSDRDSLPDGLEFNFFLTSPILADTDGDQIGDEEEILFANRNARVADLPAPTIEVGETNLQLDVRFTEVTAFQTRELENKSVTATLSQSEEQEFSNMNSNTQEAMAKLSVGTEYTVKASIFDPGGEFKSHINVETGWTGTWTSQNTHTSSTETQEAHEDSMTTEVETIETATITREVVGALMQISLFIKNASNLAYKVHNLQVTAFMQRPDDPTRLEPVATLLPDAEPEGGFTLGPLVPERGPFILSNDLIFPNLVESLMKNPRGLVFGISNFDISDELGRNFAFSSQEVVERTAALVIDNGNYDNDGDGEGDLTEYHRVATGSGRLMDTNGDSVIDGDDRRVVFDAEGKQLGITLKDALAAIGLTAFDEEATPTASLSEQEIATSYSTILDDADVERIFRIRETAAEEGLPKAWEIMTPTGIDQTVDLDALVLRPGGDLKLVFAQDIDQDRLPANIEYLNNCSDVLTDTDGDGLDDRTETLLGWDVQTGLGARRVFARCSMEDTDRDGVTDAEESGQGIDCDGDGVVDATWVTDPSSKDTDQDGVDDRDEICGFEVVLRSTGETIVVQTDPTNPDTDGDTAKDGLESSLGGNPTDIADRDDFADDDGDGLVNIQETDGWDIEVYAVSATPTMCNTVCDEGVMSVVSVTSDPYDADSDDDGIIDGEEHYLGTNPIAKDTDGDELTDYQEVRGFELRDMGIIVLDPVDADTDNDKLSDGQEAEINSDEQDRWIVRVFEEAPYRVFSDPLQADADFDTLADGDEHFYGTDPTHFNTDDDKRDDALEIPLGLNPLKDDFLMQRIQVTVDQFVCTKSDDEGAGNDADIDRLYVTANAYNRKTNYDSGVQINPVDEQIYGWSTGGEWTVGVGSVRTAGTSIYLLFDIDNYDIDVAKLDLHGWGREYDTTSSDEYGYGDLSLLGREFANNGGVHAFTINSEDFAFRVDITITFLEFVPSA